jgi:hypothetical protein
MEFADPVYKYIEDALASQLIPFQSLSPDDGRLSFLHRYFKTHQP